MFAQLLTRIRFLLPLIFEIAMQTTTMSSLKSQKQPALIWNKTASMHQLEVSSDKPEFVWLQATSNKQWPFACFCALIDDEPNLPAWALIWFKLASMTAQTFGLWRCARTACVFRRTLLRVKLSEVCSPLQHQSRSLLQHY